MSSGTSAAASAAAGAAGSGDRASVDSKSSRSSGESSSGGSSLLWSGWILKWTNYIRGYRQRWFTLDKHGHLRYFRNPSDVGHSCRGSMNLANSFIHTENACNFTLTSGQQTFHLKALSEADRQKWVTQMRMLRFKAIKKEESDEEQELKMEQQLNDTSGDQMKEMLGTSDIEQMQCKVKDTRLCHDLLIKHSASLQKCLTELETQALGKSSDPAALHDTIKVLTERIALLKITTEATIHASADYVKLAESYNAKWQQLFFHERQQRKRLENQFQRLAKDHHNLEQVAMTRQLSVIEPTAPSGQDKGISGSATIAAIPTSTVYSESDDDESDFHDALDEMAGAAGSGSNRSGLSKLRRSGSTASADEPDATAEQQQTAAAQQAAVHAAAKKQPSNSQHNHEYFNATIVTSAANGKSRESSMEREARGHVNEPSSSSSTSSDNAGEQQVARRRPRRTSLPPKPNSSVSLWSIMRNCIGKDLSKIPMPVNFNEPLSFIQRITEDLEYSWLLDRAASKTDSCEQLCYVAAFTVSMYSTSSNNRATKPFNPLLGETYECDRSDDMGWKCITEQVSHHPPVAAQHCQSRNGWTVMQEFSITSKFRGKYLSVVPTGVCHIHFKNTGNHYTYRRVTTTVHNIIVGKLWIDHHGETVIENHATGDKCSIKYAPFSYFSSEEPRKVTCLVQDKSGVVRYLLQGTWDGHLDCMKVLKANDAKSSKPVLETEAPQRIWRKHPLPPGADKFYFFTGLAVQLNEPEDGVAPTDSRMRPDQRLMETGDWDKANSEKLRLEEKQRRVRKQRETEAERAMQQGKSIAEHTPCWFSKQVDEWEGGVLHMYNGEYWTCKQRQDWSRCPNIF